MMQVSFCSHLPFKSYKRFKPPHILVLRWRFGAIIKGRRPARKLRRKTLFSLPSAATKQGTGLKILRTKTF